MLAGTQPSARPSRPAGTVYPGQPRKLKTKPQIHKAVQKILRRERVQPFLEVKVTSRTELETR